MSASAVAGNGNWKGNKAFRNHRIDEIFDLDRALRNLRFKPLRTMLYEVGFADLP